MWPQGRGFHSVGGPCSCGRHGTRAHFRKNSMKWCNLRMCCRGWQVRETILFRLELVLGRWGRIAVIGLLMLVGLAPAGSLAEYDRQLEAVLDARIRPWLGDPVVVEAIRTQNERTSQLSAADIHLLDRQWRLESAAGGGPLIRDVLNNALSRYLKEKARGSGGLFLEILVMDARGLNVGISGVTSDYMQGDERQWTRTFLLGPDAVLFEDVGFDQSSRAFQSRISATVVDPVTGRPIGAVTVGINVEKLDGALATDR